MTNHMIYDFSDDDMAVPNLEDFKEKLVSQMLRSAFFQNEVKENIIMTKIPNIIAPGLVKQQVNSDSDKKTLFNKPVSYSSETMAGLTLLITRKKIDILNLDDLTSAETKKISRDLHLKSIASKSNVRLLEEIKFVCKLYAAGQGMLVNRLIKPVATGFLILRMKIEIQGKLFETN